MSLKNLEAQIKELTKTKVNAGWFARHKYPDGTPVAYVAAIQEYGAHTGRFTIPPRPFLRPAENDNKDKWASIAGKEVKKVINGHQSVKGASDSLGLVMQDDILHKIITNQHALSPVTLLLRKWRKEGREMSYVTVLEAMKELNKNPNTKVSSNTTPLDDTGLMIASLNHEVKS